MYAANMQAEISSLQEALSTSIAEKDEALSKVDFLTSELEEYVNKLSLVESEKDSLSEKIAALVWNRYLSKQPLSDLFACTFFFFYMMHIRFIFLYSILSP